MNNLESLQKLLEQSMRELQSYMDLINQMKEENVKKEEEHEYNIGVLTEKIQKLQQENDQQKNYIQSSDGLVKMYDKNEELKIHNEVLGNDNTKIKKTSDDYLLEIYDKDRVIKEKDDKIEELNVIIKEHVNKEVE